MNSLTAVASRSSVQQSSWPRAALGAICDIVIGRTPRRDSPEYWNGSLPWTAIGDLNDETVTTTRERITEAGAEASGARLLPAGTLLFSFKLTIGKMAIAGVDLYTNEAIAGLVPRADVQISTEYLRYALSTVDVSGGASHAVKGRTLNLPLLRAIQVPFPPLPEQMRIAATLREKLDEAARMRDAAEARSATLTALMEAVLRDAFEAAPLSVDTERSGAPRGWQWRLLTDIARLESGHTPSRRHPEWWGGDVPWLALPDIRELDCQVAMETTETTNHLGIENSSARVLPTGTVVLSRTASVGFVAMMGRPMATSQDFVNWVCGDDLDPRFLMYLLRTARVTIRAMSSGAIHKTVYVPTVKAFRVCIPPVEEQRRIAAQIESKMHAIEDLRRRIRDQLADIDRLPSAILRQTLA